MFLDSRLISILVQSHESIPTLKTKGMSTFGFHALGDASGGSGGHTKMFRKKHQGHQAEPKVYPSSPNSPDFLHKTKGFKSQWSSSSQTSSQNYPTSSPGPYVYIKPPNPALKEKPISKTYSSSFPIIKSAYEILHPQQQIQQQNPPIVQSLSSLQSLPSLEQQIQTLRKDQTDMTELLLDFLHETESHSSKTRITESVKNLSNRIITLEKKLDNLSKASASASSATSMLQILSTVRLMQRQLVRIEQESLPTLFKTVDQLQGLSQWVYATVYSNELFVYMTPDSKTERVGQFKRGDTITCTQNIQETAEGLWIQIRIAEHASTPLWVMLIHTEDDTPTLGDYCLK